MLLKSVEVRLVYLFDLLKSEPARARTEDPKIKSLLLYQLSYGLMLCNLLLYHSLLFQVPQIPLEIVQKQSYKAMSLMEIDFELKIEFFKSSSIHLHISFDFCL